MADHINMMQAALHYAAKGWPVFPCWEMDESDAAFQYRVSKMPTERRAKATPYKGKQPRTIHGLKDATTEEKTIREWWRRYPNAAIGIPTGPTIGAFVLDVDLPDGQQMLDNLEAAHGPLPSTVAQRTGSGGRQLFFAWPQGVEIRNSAGKLAENLDTRGDGGYVIVPPSLHPSGGRYAWSTNGGTPIANAPQWLIEMARKPEKPEATPAEDPRLTDLPATNTTRTRTGTADARRQEGYGDAAFVDEINKVGTAPEGQRNATLNHAAFRLGQLVAGGCLDKATVAHALVNAAIGVGLDKQEAAKTMASGLAAGMQSPRGPKDDGRRTRSASTPATTAQAQGDGTAVVPATGEIIDINRAIEMEQRGAADLYVALRRGRRVFDHAEAKWYGYNGVAWERDDCGGAMSDVEIVAELVHEEAKRRGKALAEVMAKDGRNRDAIKAAMDYLRQAVTRTKELRKKPYIADMLKLAADGKDALATSGDAWDKHPHLLPVANGVIDLRTGQPYPGNPDDMLRAQSPTTWQGIDAPCPQWERFVADIHDGDVELIEYVQTLLGYSITGYTTEQIFPVLYGEKGRNGKGTMIETIAAILGGRLAGPSPSEILLSQERTKNASAPTPEILSLYGRRLSWCSETEDEKRFNAAKVKYLTGRDTLVGRPPYGKAEVMFDPTHKLFLLTNYIPTANPDDYAFWERLRMVEYHKTYVEDPDPDDANQLPKDTELPDRLATEASGILAWLVRGAVKWFKDGLRTPKSVKDATRKLRGELDHLDDFIEECCNTGLANNCSVSTAYMFAAYKAWCFKAQQMQMQQTSFGIKMKKRFNKTEDRRYIGVALKEDWLHIVSNNR